MDNLIKIDKNLSLITDQEHYDEDVGFVHNKFVELHTQKPWSLYELRFLVKVISKLKPNDIDIIKNDEIPMLEFTKVEFQKFIRTSSDDYFSDAKLGQFADTFQERKMDIANQELKNKGGFDRIVIFPRCMYNPEKKKVYVEIHRKLIPFFINFENNYLFVICKHVFILKDWRSVYLYIMLRRYVYHCQKKGSIDLSIKHIKGVMGLQDKYKTSNYNFISKVIKVAVEAINTQEELDINIQYNTIQYGREIRSINFKVQIKDNYFKYAIPQNKIIIDGETGFAIDEIPKDIMKTMFHELCVPLNKIKDYIKEYGVSYIRNKIGLLEYNIKIQNISNPTKYLNSAILKNYTIPALAKYVGDADHSKTSEDRWDKIETFCERYNSKIEELYFIYKESKNVPIDLQQLQQKISGIVKDNKDLSNSKRPILTLFINNSTCDFSTLLYLDGNMVKQNKLIEMDDISEKIKKYKFLMDKEEEGSALIDLYKEKITNLIDSI